MENVNLKVSKSSFVQKVKGLLGLKTKPHDTVLKVQGIKHGLKNPKM